MAAKKNNDLERVAKDAIREYYSDSDVSAEQCAANMRDLIEEIEIMIDALPKEESE